MYCIEPGFRITTSEVFVPAEINGLRVRVPYRGKKQASNHVRGQATRITGIVTPEKWLIYWIISFIERNDTFLIISIASSLTLTSLQRC